jgi:uncharacterized RDD family membrane protein YckC
MEYAGLGRRIAAALVDGTIIFLAWLALLWTTDGLQGMYLLWWVVSVAYYTPQELRYGASLGKRLVGLRVAKADGRALDPPAALVRNLARLVDGLGFYALGVVVLGQSPHQQRVGDRLAGTVVVRGAHMPPPPDVRPVVGARRPDARSVPPVSAPGRVALRAWAAAVPAPPPPPPLPAAPTAIAAPDAAAESLPMAAADAAPATVVAPPSPITAVDDPPRPNAESDAARRPERAPVAPADGAEQSVAVASPPLAVPMGPWPAVGDTATSALWEVRLSRYGPYEAFSAIPAAIPARGRLLVAEIGARYRGEGTATFGSGDFVLITADGQRIGPASQTSGLEGGLWLVQAGSSDVLTERRVVFDVDPAAAALGLEALGVRFRLPS